VGGICGFAGNSGGWRSVRLRQPRLTFRNLLFAIFVKRIHDVVQALINDLAVASHHRHRFSSAQILGQINQNTTQREQLKVSFQQTAGAIAGLYEFAPDAEVEAEVEA